jgi:hypothetical protein
MRSVLAVLYFISLSAIVLAAADDHNDTPSFIPGFKKDSPVNNDLPNPLTKPATPSAGIPTDLDEKSSGDKDDKSDKSDKSDKEDSSKDTKKDSSKDLPKDTKEDSFKPLPKDSTKDSKDTKDLPKDNKDSKDLPKDNKDSKVDTPFKDFTETPEGDSPLKDSPLKDSPVKEEDPLKDSPIKEEDPLKDSPLKDSPLKDSPAKDSPVKDSPAKDSPIKDSPVKDSPVNDSPLKNSPVKDTFGSDNDSHKKPTNCNKKCTNGAFACDGKGFKKCDHNAWVKFQCAPGTACVPVGKDVILCDYDRAKKGPIEIQPAPQSQDEIIDQVATSPALPPAPATSPHRAEEDSAEWKKGIKLDK